MEELNKEYTLLFNGITDAIQQLENLTRQLKKLQLRAEEAYLQECEPQPADEEESQP